VLIENVIQTQHCGPCGMMRNTKCEMCHGGQ